MCPGGYDTSQPRLRSRYLTPKARMRVMLHRFQRTLESPLAFDSLRYPTTKSHDTESSPAVFDCARAVDVCLCEFAAMQSTTLSMVKPRRDILAWLPRLELRERSIVDNDRVCSISIRQSSGCSIAAMWHPRTWRLLREELLLWTRRIRPTSERCRNVT